MDPSRTGKPGKKKKRRDGPIPTIRKKICEALAEGATFRSASWIAGVSHLTAAEWRRRGNEIGGYRNPRGRKEKLLWEFAQSVEMAMAKRQLEWAKRVLKAGEGETCPEVRVTETPNGEHGMAVQEVMKKNVTRKSWKANAWMLEKNYPEEFGAPNTRIPAGEKQDGEMSPAEQAEAIRRQVETEISGLNGDGMHFFKPVSGNGNGSDTGKSESDEMRPSPNPMPDPGPGPGPDSGRGLLPPGL